MEEFNEQLAQACRADLERRLRGQPTTKQGLLEEEQRVLLPLPKQSFEARRVEQAKANSLSLVRFDTNDYSVPTAYAHHPVTAVGNIQEVRLIVGDRVVARHPRDWARENVHYDPLHYLALLERKPGALDFARPLADWKMLECFGVLRRRLEAERQSDGRREFIKVLRLLEILELGELARATERALAIGALTVDAIRLLAQSGREQPARWFSLAGRPHLQGHDIPPPHLDRYAALLPRGASLTPGGVGLLPGGERYMERHAKVRKRSWKEDQAQFDRYLKSWSARKLYEIKRADVQGVHRRVGEENGRYSANRVLALVRKVFIRCRCLFCMIWTLPAC